MKQKTEWGNLNFAIKKDIDYWILNSGKAYYTERADLRWINFYNLELLEMNGGQLTWGAILGDQDETKY